MPMSSAAPSASRCISGTHNLCGIISFGAIGHINAEMPKAASVISPQRSCWGKGRSLDPLRLRWALRLRRLTRTVRQYGKIRLHNFGLYVEQSLWGHTVEVWIYDDVVRIEQGEHVVVSSPCLYDPRQRRSIDVQAHGRQQYCQIPVMQLVLWTLALARTVWRMPRYRRMAAPRPVLLAQQITSWQRFAD